MFWVLFYITTDDLKGKMGAIEEVWGGGGGGGGSKVLELSLKVQ